MTAKERARIKLLEYLGNPDNDFMTRELLSTQVLGYKQTQAIHKIFTGAEISAIEQEALEIRRTKYARFLAGVDMGQLRKAIDGDTAAAQLVYKRLEGWSEKIKGEFTGKDGEAIKTENRHTMNMDALKKAMES